MSAYDMFFSKRWPASKVDSQPYRFALFVGSIIGIASAVLGILFISTILLLFSPEVLGPSAAAYLSSLNPVALFFYGVLIVPCWETLIAQLFPIELAKRVGLNEPACIIICAVIFGLGHYINGGIGHGLGTLIGGALFALSYVIVRPWGYLPAFWASYTAHSLNNMLLLFVVPVIFPRLA